MRKIAMALAVVVLIVAGVFAWRAYLVHELRKPVRAELNDPDSALFRNERLLFGWSEWTVKGNVLCGEVNAKNKMGGYVGYAKFSSVAGLHANIGSNDFELGFVSSECR
ncbi:hypothetical protein [Pantoea sp. 18069]|uniref:hypothetical protein n=1 Tax=Pantoea sp. 18069 TaxID=2681415 RepID=UPI00135887B2|nr:hypothetical protein [Pantoea sp. 18069]